MADLDDFYNILTLIINRTFKFTINNVRIEPKFDYHLIRMSLNDNSIVGRAINTHLIIYNREAESYESNNS